PLNIFYPAFDRKLPRNTGEGCLHLLTIFQTINLKRMTKNFTQMRALGFFTVVWFFCLTTAIGQSSGPITGKIVHEDGTPAIGAIVTVKGTAQAAVADTEGNYRISAPESGTLVFTMIGSISQEVAVEGRK